MFNQGLPKYMLLQEDSDELRDTRISTELHYNNDGAKIQTKKINNTVPHPCQLYSPGIHNIQYSSKHQILFVATKQHIIIKNQKELQGDLIGGKFDSNTESTLKCTGQLYLSPSQSILAIYNQNEIQLVKIDQIDRQIDVAPLKVENESDHFLWVDDSHFITWKFEGEAVIYQINSSSLALVNRKKLDEVTKCSGASVIQGELFIIEWLIVKHFKYKGGVSLLKQHNFEEIQHDSMYFSFSCIIDLFKVNIGKPGFSGENILGLVMVMYDDEEQTPDMRYLTFMKGNIIEDESFQFRGQEMFFTTKDCRQLYYQDDKHLPFAVKRLQVFGFICIMIQRSQVVYIVDPTEKFQKLNIFALPSKHQLKDQNGDFFRGFALMKNMLPFQKQLPQKSTPFLNQIVKKYDGQFMSLYFKDKETNLTIMFPASLVACTDKLFFRRYAISTIGGIEKDKDEDILVQIDKIKRSTQLIDNEQTVSLRQEQQENKVKKVEKINQVKEEKSSKEIKKEEESSNQVKKEEKPSNSSAQIPSVPNNNTNNGSSLFGKPSVSQNKSFFGFGAAPSNPTNSTTNSSSLFGKPASGQNKPLFGFDSAPKNNQLFETKQLLPKQKDPTIIQKSSQEQPVLTGNTLFGQPAPNKEEEKVSNAKIKAQQPAILSSQTTSLFSKGNTQPVLFGSASPFSQPQSSVKTSQEPKEKQVQAIKQAASKQSQPQGEKNPISSSQTTSIFGQNNNNIFGKPIIPPSGNTSLFGQSSYTSNNTFNTTFATKKQQTQIQSKPLVPEKKQKLEVKMQPEVKKQQQNKKQPSNNVQQTKTNSQLLKSVEKIRIQLESLNKQRKQFSESNQNEKNSLKFYQKLRQNELNYLQNLDYKVFGMPFDDLCEEIEGLLKRFECYNHIFDQQKGQKNLKQLTQSLKFSQNRMTNLMYFMNLLSKKQTNKNKSSKISQNKQGVQTDRGVQNLNKIKQLNQRRILDLQQQINFLAEKIEKQSQLKKQKSKIVEKRKVGRSYAFSSIADQDQEETNYTSLASNKSSYKPFQQRKKFQYSKKKVIIDLNQVGKQEPIFSLASLDPPIQKKPLTEPQGSAHSQQIQREKSLQQKSQKLKQPSSNSTSSFGERIPKKVVIPAIKQSKQTKVLAEGNSELIDDDSGSDDLQPPVATRQISFAQPKDLKPTQNAQQKLKKQAETSEIQSLFDKSKKNDEKTKQASSKPEKVEAKQESSLFGGLGGLGGGFAATKSKQENKNSEKMPDSFMFGNMAANLEAGKAKADLTAPNKKQQKSLFGNVNGTAQIGNNTIQNTASSKESASLFGTLLSTFETNKLETNKPQTQNKPAEKGSLFGCLGSRALFGAGKPKVENSLADKNDKPNESKQIKSGDQQLTQLKNNSKGQVQAAQKKKEVSGTTQQLPAGSLFGQAASVGSKNSSLFGNVTGAGSSLFGKNLQEVPSEKNAVVSTPSKQQENQKEQIKQNIKTQKNSIINTFGKSQSIPQATQAPLSIPGSDTNKVADLFNKNSASLQKEGQLNNPTKADQKQSSDADKQKQMNADKLNMNIFGPNKPAQAPKPLNQADSLSAQPQVPPKNPGIFGGAPNQQSIFTGKPTSNPFQQRNAEFAGNNKFLADNSKANANTGFDPKGVSFSFQGTANKTFSSVSGNNNSNQNFFQPNNNQTNGFNQNSTGFGSNNNTGSQQNGNIFGGNAAPQVSSAGGSMFGGGGNQGSMFGGGNQGSMFGGGNQGGMFGGNNQSNGSMFANANNMNSFQQGGAMSQPMNQGSFNMGGNMGQANNQGGSFFGNNNNSGGNFLSNMPTNPPPGASNNAHLFAIRQRND